MGPGPRLGVTPPGVALVSHSHFTGLGPVWTPFFYFSEWYGMWSGNAVCITFDFFRPNSPSSPAVFTDQTMGGPFSVCLAVCKIYGKMMLEHLKRGSLSDHVSKFLCRPCLHIFDPLRPFWTPTDPIGTRRGPPSVAVREVVCRPPKSGLVVWFVNFD